MKKIWLTAVIAVLISIQNGAWAIPAVLSAQGESFDWMVGEWERSNEKADRQTYETWTKNSDTEYVGYSLTVLHNDTIWQEKTKLYKSSNGWVLEVMLKEDSKPTIFDLTAVKKNMFICENEKNEFPKVIQYQKKGGTLEAILTGNGMETKFEFKKK
jgi:acetyl-CoA carboxylase beta subunit